jgi:hypothetical protein
VADSPDVIVEAASCLHHFGKHPVTTAAQRTANSTLFSVGVRSVVWWARWALVLLLVIDQIGSPLHGHHHDSGIDGSHFQAQRSASPGAFAQVEKDDRGPTAFHAVTALRVKARTLAAVGQDDTDAPQIASASAAAREWVGVQPADVAHVPRLPLASHRPNLSLPPQGHAPPRRA